MRNQFTYIFFILLLIVIMAVDPCLVKNSYPTHEDRLRRIVEECLEVSFILCNSEMDEFGVSKIFDIFYQNFTTAYVLNTGYWPFFSAPKGHCLCVCGRFGLPCRHIRSDHHWMDMQPIENSTGDTIFYPKLHGPITPESYQISINPINGEAYSYNLLIHLKVIHKKLDKGKLIRRDKIVSALLNNQTLKPPKQNTSFTIHARFTLYPEYYHPFYNLLFQPNPFYHQHYGTLFKNLIYLRAFEYSNCYNVQLNIWYASSGSMPSSTFILDHVNVPTFKIPGQVWVYFNPVAQQKHKYQRRKRTRSTQTSAADLVAEEENGNEGESQLKETVNDNWEYYGNSQKTLSQTLRNIAASTSNLSVDTSRTDDPVPIEDSEEYDIQLPNLGYDRAIVKPDPNVPSEDSDCNIKFSPKCATLSPSFTEPRQTYKYKGIKRKCQMYTNYHVRQITPNIVEEFTMSCEDQIETNIVSSTFKSEDFPFLVPEQPQAKKMDLNYSKALKKSTDKDAEWFEKNFPSLISKRRMKKSEIDEELELIESVIMEDITYTKESVNIIDHKEEIKTDETAILSINVKSEDKSENMNWWYNN